MVPSLWEAGVPWREKCTFEHTEAHGIEVRVVLRGMGTVYTWERRGQMRSSRESPAKESGFYFTGTGRERCIFNEVIMWLDRNI